MNTYEIWVTGETGVGKLRATGNNFAEAAREYVKAENWAKIASWTGSIVVMEGSKVLSDVEYTDGQEVA